MTFIPNLKAVDELAAELKRARALRPMADAAKDKAQEMAPVLTGAYRDSIEVVDGEDGPILVANDWKSIFIEFGTARQSPVAPLRRAVVDVGFQLKGKKK